MGGMCLCECVCVPWWKHGMPIKDWQVQRSHPSNAAYLRSMRETVEKITVQLCVCAWQNVQIPLVQRQCIMISHLLNFHGYILSRLRNPPLSAPAPLGCGEDQFQFGDADMLKWSKMCLSNFINTKMQQWMKMKYRAEHVQTIHSIQSTLLLTKESLKKGAVVPEIDFYWSRLSLRWTKSGDVPWEVRVDYNVFHLVSEAHNFKMAVKYIIRNNVWQTLRGLITPGLKSEMASLWINVSKSCTL